MSQSLNGKGVVQILVGFGCLAGAWYYGHISSASSAGGLDRAPTDLPAEDLVWNTAPVSPPPLQDGASGSTQPDAELQHRNAASGPNANRDNPGPMLAPPDFSQLAAEIDRERALQKANALKNSLSEIPPVASAVERPEIAAIPPPAPQLQNAAAGASRLVPVRAGVPQGNDVEPTLPFTAGTFRANSFTGSESSQVLRPILDSQPQTDTGGSVLSATSGLSPLSSRVSELQVTANGFKIHVVRPGETLQTLSRDYFGSADYYLDIYACNQDVLDSPAAIRSGVSLRIPVSGEQDR